MADDTNTPGWLAILQVVALVLSAIVLAMTFVRAYAAAWTPIDLLLMRAAIGANVVSSGVNLVTRWHKSRALGRTHAVMAAFMDHELRVANQGVAHATSEVDVGVDAGADAGQHAAASEAEEAPAPAPEDAQQHDADVLDLKDD